MIALVMGAFFYWPENWLSKETLPDASSEANKERCLENTAKMTDQELINEIKNLEYIKGVASSTEELDKLNFAIVQTTEYLNCKLAENKDQQLYNTAKEFINGLLIEDKAKERFLSRLNNVYSEEFVSFVETYAFKSIEELCPNGQIDPDFLKLCLTGGNLSEDVIDRLSPERREKDIKNCYQFCSDIKEYNQDPSIFEKEFDDFNWYPDAPILYCYKFPIIIAYIIEGEELAMKVCDSIPIPEMEELCKNDVERYLSDRKCTKSRQNLIDIICIVHKS